ncbi:hypothetical protein SAMN04490244_101170 [Tranquillimonas rosea]|uniref:Uncharacterized protein n=1 Tax=Tranquillimonas rosea TaxID=641238 RepID=A0A1H9PGG2_9RHOB|nr:hypothetical protein [Tranquillimonas rosea]SER47244.1 hypothetical protein SAMN04490244_101170 [Tranquillimonas rosea]
MTSSPTSYRLGAILVFAGSVAAFVLALYAYLTPLTGVNGTLGALGLVIGTLVLALAALVLPALRGRAGRNVLRLVILAGLLAALVAGLLLHRWFVGVAMVLGLIGIFLDMTRPARAADPTRTKG